MQTNESNSLQYPYEVSLNAFNLFKLTHLHIQMSQKLKLIISHQIYIQYLMKVQHQLIHHSNQIKQIF